MEERPDDSFTPAFVLFGLQLDQGWGGVGRRRSIRAGFGAIDLAIRRLLLVLVFLLLGASLVVLDLSLDLPPLLCGVHDLEAPQFLKLAVPDVYLRVVRVIFTRKLYG